MGPEAHPNSVAIHLRGATRAISILGASTGGGMIEIRGSTGFRLRCRRKTRVFSSSTRIVPAS
jgi:hypothetical protein